MSLPQGRQDLTGNLVTAANLGLDATGSDTGTAITTPCPVTNVLLAGNSAGACVIKVSVHSGSANFGSPDATITIANSDTTLHAATFNTTSSKLQYSVQIVNDGDHARTTDRLACVTLGKMTTGEGWPDATSALNAVQSTVVGDGSGTFTVTL